MNIPKRFTVGTTKYTVFLMDPPKTRSTGCAFGSIHFAWQYIYVQPRFEANMEKTFWHEVVHAILHDMGRARLNNDEQFVDDFAKRLHQITKTAKF